MSTPLSDIRMLIGFQIGTKGLPPTIIAPILNILTLLDSHLITIGLDMPLEIEKETLRLQQAIILMNHEDEEDESEDEVDEDEDPFHFPLETDDEDDDL